MRHVVEPLGGSDQPASTGDDSSVAHGSAARTASILVATDGTRASGAALKVAAELAARDGDWVEALTVELPFPADVSGLRFSAETVRADDSWGGEALRPVTKQLLALMKGDRWSLRVEFGRLAHTIARMARETNARLIVLGRGEHKMLRRTIGVDAIAHVLHETKVPVLAVPATADRLPRTGVALMDFSPSSFRAAREALSLLEPPATLHLLHVRARLEGSGETQGWAAVYDAGITAVLSRLARAWTREGISVQAPVVLGSVTSEALPYARSVDADLIACGSHGCSAVERVLLGSMSTKILHKAQCAVLVAPPEDSGEVSV